MAYKVYKKNVGSESVELVNDKEYETRDEAEVAMREAESEIDKKNKLNPNPEEIYGHGPGQTNVLSEKTVDGEIFEQEEKVKFFIRET